MSGLLGKQLANISDTLAKASQRRNAEVQRRSPQPPAAPTASAPVPTEFYLTSDIVAGSSAIGSPSVPSHKPQTKPTLQSPGQYDLDLSKANTIMGEETAQASLRGGYISDEDDSAKVLASFETKGAAANAHREEISAQASKSEFSTTTMQGDLKAEMLQMWHTAPPSGTEGETEDDIDPVRLLATFDNTPSARQTTVRVKSEDVDSEQTLASSACSWSFSPGAPVEAPMSITAGLRQSIDAHPLATDPDWEARFEKLLEGLHTPTAQSPQAILGGDDDKDPRSMLAAIEQESALAHNNDPKWMLAELERGLLQGDIDEDNDESLDAFRARLTSTLSSSAGHAYGAQKFTDANTTSTVVCSEVDSLVTLDKTLLPYTIALQLEIAGIPWEEIQGWTTYLFSEGLDGYKACQDKDAIVKRANEELDKTIAQVTEETKHYWGIQDEVRLPCRVIISNIAAGADVGDLQEFFRSFRFVVEEIRMLPGRDPVKRTKVAHMDMVSRHYAIQASFMTGSIFGLMLKIELAVEKKD
ncbi:hypothetical protein HBI13_024800 [Parastagonospora nodorum]|nr:hypothetical protein HBI10_041350 [Parastagonospora nodorum]KAH4030782.1 hypothetical protein HBI13_024800 [Parastagonospora nodorum]